MKTCLHYKKSRPFQFVQSTAIGLVILLFGACSKPTESAKTRVVSVVKVVRANLANTMTLQAEFEPYQDILLHGKVSGYVNMIRVDIGDRVKTGDLIATIEVPELAAQLESALASQKKAQSDYQIAHLNYDRLQGVIRSQPTLVAQQDLDDAEAKESSAAAALAATKAETGRYTALVAYTKITAPFDGVITKRFVDLGSLIQAGTSSNPGALVALSEDDRLRLRFPVPESETPNIHIGEVVQISVDALHRTLTGKIARDTAMIDRATRTMMTEVEIPNTDGTLKAGMYASIILPLEAAENVLTVPLQALSPGEHPSVLVVGDDGTVKEQAVSLGLRTASTVEVKSGLVEGAHVITSDRGGLHSGDKVSAKDMEAQASE